MLSFSEAAQQVKLLSKDSSVRRAENKFIIEGQKIVSDFITNNFQFEYVLVDNEHINNDKCLQSLTEQLKEWNVPVHMVKPARFQGLSSVKSPQGIIAVVRRKEYNLNDILNRSSLRIVIGEGMQDPVNAGIMVRNALAFHFDALLFTENSADVFSPKGIRVASSVINLLPIFYLPLHDILSFIKKNCILLLVSDLRSDSISLDKCLKNDKLAVVFGSEGEGISPAMRSAADCLFHIPMAKVIDSLNVSVASGIILHHFSHI
ncbi:MAG: RNA methyltransferase [Candidatus Auribacterota bacterium]